MYHTKEHYKAWVKANGLPVPIAPHLKQEILAAGLPLPTMRENIGIVFPPHVGDGDPDLVAWDDGLSVWHDETGEIVPRDDHTVVLLEEGGPCCAHCGSHVDPDAGLMLHALAGLEDATDDAGNPLRLLVRHCGGCAGSAHCDPNQTSPNAQVPAGLPSGFCEPIDATEQIVASAAAVQAAANSARMKERSAVITRDMARDLNQIA